MNNVFGDEMKDTERTLGKKRVIRKLDDGYFIRVQIPASQFLNRQPRHLELTLPTELLKVISNGMQQVLSYGDNKAGEATSLHANLQANLIDADGRSSIADLTSSADISKNAIKLHFWSGEGKNNIISATFKPDELSIERSLNPHQHIRPSVFDYRSNDQACEVYRHIVNRVVSSSERDQAGLIYQMNESIIDGNADRAIQIIKSGILFENNVFFSYGDVDRFKYPMSALFIANRDNLNLPRKNPENHVIDSLSIIDASIEAGLVGDGFRHIFLEPDDEIFHHAFDALIELKNEDVRQDAINTAMNSAMSSIMRHDIPNRQYDFLGRLDRCKEAGWVPDRRLIKNMLRLSMLFNDHEKRASQASVFEWMFSQGALSKDGFRQGGEPDLLSVAIYEEQEEIAILMVEHGEPFCVMDINKAQEKMTKLAACMEFKRLGSQVSSTTINTERPQKSGLHRSVGF